MSDSKLYVIQDIFDELKHGSVIPLYEGIIEQYNRDITELRELVTKYPDIKRFKKLLEMYEYKAELIHEILTDEKKLVLNQAQIEADQYEY